MAHKLMLDSEVLQHGNQRQQRLLLALPPGQWRSGEQLAQDLAVSRVSVNNYIGQLQACGFPIESLHGKGYRLAAGYCPLDAGGLRDALAMPVYAAAFCVSSNDWALDWLRSQPLERSGLFVAEYQSAGRGRRGRRWQAGPGQALLCSLAYRFSRQPADLPALSLLVALVLCESLLQLYPALQGRLHIKWPNDLLLDGKKLAGILIETQWQGDDVAAVVGVGVNVAMPQAATRYPATGLAQVGKAISRVELLKAWVPRFLNELGVYEKLGFEAFLPRYRAFDVVTGKSLLLDGEPLQVVDIDATGALVVDNDGEKRRYVCGELSLPWPFC